MSWDGSGLPPQNLEAERSVIGGIILENGMIDEIIRDVAASDFYNTANQHLFTVCLDLWERNSKFDSILLCEELMRRSLFEIVGGAEYVMTLMESVPHASHTAYYARIVRERSVRRTVINVARGLLDDSYDETVATQTLLTKSLLVLEEVGSNATGEILSARQMVDRHRVAMKNPPVPLSTGLEEVDWKMNGGAYPGKLIVVGADSGMGKTSFLQQLVTAPAMRGIATLQVHLEMRDHELTERIAAQGEDYLMQYADLPIYLEQTKYTLEGICGSIRTARRKFGIKMAVIDYIQLVEAGKDKQSSVERAVPVFKRMAEDLQIPIILLAQLNRELHKRDVKRPRKTDLANSSELDRAADVIMLLHRPDVYDKQDRPGFCEIIFAKHRGGPTGIVAVGFDETKTRFCAVRDIPVRISDDYFPGEQSPTQPSTQPSTQSSTQPGYVKSPEAPF